MLKKKHLNTNRIIILLLVITFFVKGVFLVTLLPIFKGQDEARHYNTIQFLNEPKEKNWEFTKKTDDDKEKDDLSTYRFSEEIKNTALKTEANRLRYNNLDTITFTNSFEGKNEGEIKGDKVPAINKTEPVSVTMAGVYHRLGYLIENGFENQNIFVRFYLIRLFSVILASFSIIFYYFILKGIGIPKEYSYAILTLTIFQPAFSLYVTNINYAPLLILVFSSFVYGGILYIKQGFNRKNLSLLVFSTIIGLLTKGTAIVLLFALVGLIIFEIIKKTKGLSSNKFYKYILLSASVLILMLFFYGSKYLPLDDKTVPEATTSFGSYVSETLTVRKFSHTSKTYWGVYNLTNKNVTDILKYTFLILDLISAVGFLLYCFSKKKLPKYLPQKKYSLFFIFMILSLQVGVRLAGWKYFDKTGEIGLGAPGRYFLPNLVPHYCLIYVGIGTLFFYLKAQKYFKYFLAISAILMVFLSLNSIFNYLLYRYYLL